MASSEGATPPGAGAVVSSGLPVSLRGLDARGTESNADDSAAVGAQDETESAETVELNERALRRIDREERLARSANPQRRHECLLETCGASPAVLLAVAAAVALGSVVTTAVVAGTHPSAVKKEPTTFAAVLLLLVLLCLSAYYRLLQVRIKHYDRMMSDRMLAFMGYRSVVVWLSFIAGRYLSSFLGGKWYLRSKN